MAKSRDPSGDYVISETGNWNVADNFAKIKIMLPLENCDVYEDIALYGHSSFFDELINSDIDSDELRVRGLQRLINELIKLGKNARFAMKKTDTEARLLGLQKQLYEARDTLLPKTFSRYINQGNGTRGIKVNESIFSKVLEIVSEIKSKMNSPLNENHLIFTDKEEFDPRAFKDRIKDRMINKG